MADLISATEFDAADGLQDWRFILGGIEGWFNAGSFDGATSFAHRIARAANDANHHPDIDIRYPARVFVCLTTHAAGGLTNLDLELARTISAIATDSGASSEPLSKSRIEIAIDAVNIDAVRPFWQAVLGYEPRAPDEAPFYDISDPHRVGPAFWFQQMAEPRTERNRFHIDVMVPHDQAESRIAAALAAGGRLVSDKRAKAFWVLADVEGNEACVCTWQDRD